MNTNHWSVNAIIAARLADSLDEYADNTDDAHDHDEGHAAASVVRVFARRGIVPNDRIIRWVEGLI